MSRDIRKEMMEITGGDFEKWYNGLTLLEQTVYRKEFNKLQDSEEDKTRVQRST